MPSKLREDISVEQRAVGLRLQEALDLNGMTHKEFSELVGRQLRTVEGWVAGEFSPKSRALEIERILGIPVKYLLFGEGPSTVAQGDATERYITYGEFALWRKSVDLELERLRGMLIEVEAKSNGQVAQRREA